MKTMMIKKQWKKNTLMKRILKKKKVKKARNRLNKNHITDKLERMLMQ